MKKRRTLIFLVLSILTSPMFVLGCDDSGSDKDDKKKMTLLLLLSANNNSITCEQDGAQASYGQNVSGFYASPISSTLIGGGSNTVTNRSIIITFKSQTAGTYTGSGAAADHYVLIADGFTFTWSSKRTGGSATINITKYGAVGDTMEGTFSGTLKDEAETGTLTISNGIFRVRREPNL